MRCWKRAGAQRCCRFRKSRDQRLENRSPAGWRRARIERTRELFHDVKIDWLGKKWYFLGFSLIFSVAGVLSIFFWHHIPLGIDFKGGTLVYVKFDAPPSADRIREAVDRAGIRDSRIQPFGQRIGQAPSNEVIISLPE